MRLFTLLLFLTACHVPENGFILVKDRELKPHKLPWEVLVSYEVDLTHTRNAIAFWHEEVGVAYLFDPPIRVPLEYDEFGDPKPVWGAIVVQIADTPDGVGGTTTPYEVRETGTMLAAIVTISPKIVRDERLLQAVYRHELGHCLGLADDPYSFEFASIMQGTIRLDGRVSPGDRRRVRGLDAGQIVW